jgi:ferric-dicitrate binding protein FerR (iron transport regulator)
VGLAVVGVALAVRVITRNPVSTQPASTPITYATAAGQLGRVTLADGSHVRLAPLSRLVVEPGFGSAERAVSLEGEAMFEVTSASEAPFIVRTGSVTTRVLGTTFDVRHYPHDSVVRVVVTSGKVTAGGHRTPVTLTAGTMGLVTDSTAVATAVGTMDPYTSWVDGRLTFANTEVPTMLATVGRWYGYTFVLADSTIASQHVTTEFNIAARQETLAAIRSLLNVTMTFTDSTVVLHAQRPGQSAQPAPRRTRRIVPLSSEVGK